MPNFAEQCTYWYLRLNGFFPVQSYVVHRPDLAYKADIDLLAVRPRHVFEEFGGQPADWDIAFQNWGLTANAHAADWDRMIGLTVEVKAGGFSKTGKRGIQEGFFGPLRISEAVSRLGFVQGDERENVCTSLQGAAIHSDPNGAWTIGKLLVYEPTVAPNIDGEPVLSYPIGSVIDFVEERMRRYEAAKAPAFEMFPDAWIQRLLRYRTIQLAE